MKQFLNSLILVCFLTVFSVDSFSSFFELDNTITCEMNDGNDTEDESETDGEFETESIITDIAIIEPISQQTSYTFNTNPFFLSELHSFSIPTPPPEQLF